MVAPGSHAFDGIRRPVGDRDPARWDPTTFRLDDAGRAPIGLASIGDFSSTSALAYVRPLVREGSSPARPPVLHDSRCLPPRAADAAEMIAQDPGLLEVEAWRPT